MKLKTKRVFLRMPNTSTKGSMSAKNGDVQTNNNSNTSANADLNGNLKTDASLNEKTQRICFLHK